MLKLLAGLEYSSFWSGGMFPQFLQMLYKQLEMFSDVKHKTYFHWKNISYVVNGTLCLENSALGKKQRGKGRFEDSLQHLVEPYIVL